MKGETGEGYNRGERRALSCWKCQVLGEGRVLCLTGLSLYDQSDMETVDVVEGAQSLGENSTWATQRSQATCRELGWKPKGSGPGLI